MRHAAMPLALLLLLAPLAAGLGLSPAPSAPLRDAGVAEETAAPTVFLEDPEGDAKLSIATDTPAETPAPSGLGDAVDIVSLSVQEDVENLVLTYKMKTLAEDETGLELRTRFLWGGWQYTLYFEMWGIPVAGETNSYAWLQAVDETGRYVNGAEIDPVLDPSQATIALTIPRAYLLNQRDQTPGKDAVLDEFRVESWKYLGLGRFTIAGSSFLAVSDGMPDTGSAKFVFKTGDESRGTLVLTSAEKTRVSNGGSTTFVFRANLRNTGEAEDSVGLTVTDLPEGWNATYQTPVRVPAHGEKEITILASVPFAHQHGGFDAFTLHAKSGLDADSWATLRFGVLHTPIPQPAGHHQELYLHTQSYQPIPDVGLFQYVDGWMNTLSDHAGDTGEMTPNSRYNNNPAWYIRLRPDLRMGLDFDITQTATLSGSILGKTNGAATIRADLFLYRSDGSSSEGITLATGSPVDVTLDMQKATPFSLVLKPTEDADYIPHHPNQNVYLRILMEPETNLLVPGFWGAPTEPQLIGKDFLLKLPLNEYHDQLTGDTLASTALELIANGLVEKAGRPGTQMSYQFTLRNAGSEATTYKIDLAGTDAHLGVVVPSGEVTLAPNEKKTLTLGVAIPADAADGQLFEVLVFVHAKDDPGKSAVARTKTVATVTGEAVADETHVVQAAHEEQNKTPGPGALALLGAVAALALARRRQRRGEP